MKERPTINAIRKKKERDFTPVSSSSLSSSSIKSRAFVPPFLCHFSAFFLSTKERFEINRKTLKPLNTERAQQQQTSPKYFKKRE